MPRSPLHLPDRTGRGLAASLLLLGLLACDRDREAETGAGAGREGAGERAAAAERALLAAMADSASWASYGRDQTNQRYSPLSQITTANVGELQLAWRYNTGIFHSFEASPVVVDGTMYVSTPLNHVVALEAATGRRRWEYAHDYDGVTVHCCGPVNRGVAVYGDRVYMGTLDAQLIALDAGSGEVAWRTRVADNAKAYAVNGPIVAVDGKVLAGTSGAEYGIRGYIAAYDAQSGAEVWRWHTIPSPEDGGWWGQWRETDAFGVSLNRNIAREKQDSARHADSWQRGGGSVWQAPAVDRELGLVIFTVGNPSPDLDGSGRPGDNLYTNSIVALDYRTGELKWYYQQIPHDVWDLDTASPVMLVEVADSTGTRVKAVAQAGKHGWVDIVDRRSGKPLRRSRNFVPQENMYALPTEKGTRMLPGANGGSEWSAHAYHPETGYMYVLAMHQPMLYKVRPQPFKPPAMWLGGAFVGTGEPQYGLFSAVDLNSGRIAWQKRVADPMIGGAVATAGGVVFTGTKDRQFLAFDAKSGEQLWRYRSRGGVNAPPITYAVNGRQYVAVAAGGNFQINAPRSDEVLVFALKGAGGAAADTARQEASR
ncbi:MAG TPA: PQQ-binding-like beta-propeller repeat protein [Gemmatimonadales bacterium]|nr:PQQ-binding-like beta-propeller repeat protein [Gemmatimonadales bacterium]